MGRGAEDTEFGSGRLAGPQGGSVGERSEDPPQS